MWQSEIINRAIDLRNSGKTYSEIKSLLGVTVPKSTLSFWCRDVKLTDAYYKKVNKLQYLNIRKARPLALLAKKQKRDAYFNKLYANNLSLLNYLENSENLKILLAILYICEGSKRNHSALTFGNSDSNIVNLFLKLLRKCYKIDETKFRCTVQCRADQNSNNLEKYWSEITKIPLNKFYKARIDKRSINKKTKKIDYKGVCRIDYFDADIFNNLYVIADIIYKNLHNL